MKLQLALDLVNIPEGIALVKEVADYVDIVEIGTPVVINEGLHAVKEMKQAFPNLEVLADLKVMDAGGYEVMKASEAGADYITVLGVSEDATIKGAVEEAKKRNPSIQPMGSLFEQSLLLLFDALILRLMDKKGLTSGTMYGRHANLE